MKWIPGTQSQVAQTGEDKMLRYAWLTSHWTLFHFNKRNEVSENASVFFFHNQKKCQTFTR